MVETHPDRRKTAHMWSFELSRHLRYIHMSTMHISGELCVLRFENAAASSVIFA